MGSDKVVSMMKKAKTSVGLFAKELIPRYKAPIAKPLKILARYGEFQKRRNLAEALARQENADVARLRREGHTVLKSETVDTSEVSRAGAARLAETIEFAQRGGKAFFSQLLTPEDKKLSSPFMRFALNEEILRSVAAYLGGAPYLEYVDLLYSKPVQTRSASQLWHKDRTDHALIKIFVYCLDVSSENGPFSFFSSIDSARIPEYLPHYLPDEKMAEYVPLSNVISLTGKAGTALMIDTRHCYHFGSRCIQPRLAYVSYYTSGFGYYPRETKWDLGDFPIGGLSSLQRMALGF
jgi:hypothetical protein